MYILGTCNPRGEDPSYNGLYFKQSELNELVANRSLCGIPVKAEHTGADVGSIVSAYVDSDQKLNCVINIPEKNFQECLVANLVRDRVALDLSMGYSVEVQHTRRGREQTSQSKLHAKTKKTLEVSLVRKGARKGCHILAFEDKKGDLRWPKIASTSSPSTDKPPTNDWTQFSENFIGKPQ